MICSEFQGQRRRAEVGAFSSLRTEILLWTGVMIRRAAAQVGGDMPGPWA